MFGFNKWTFIALLTFIGLLATKCISLYNEPCLARATLIDLNSNDLHHYPFKVSLDKCHGSCNALEDLSSKICVPNKTNDGTLNVFNMIEEINESRALTTLVSCYCKLKFDGKKSNSN